MKCATYAAIPIKCRNPAILTDARSKIYNRTQPDLCACKTCGKSNWADVRKMTEDEKRNESRREIKKTKEPRQKVIVAMLLNW